MVEQFLADPILLALAGVIAGLSISVLGSAGVTLYLRVKNIRTARHWRGLEEKWDPLILQALHEDLPLQRVWQSVDATHALYFVGYLVRYVRRLSGAEREVIQRLADPYLPKITHHILVGDETQRARAVQTLGEFGFAKYATTIQEALDDPSTFVTMAAARALVRSGRPELADAVLQELDRFEHWRPRFLSAMLASAGQGAVPALRATFVDRSRKPRTRSIAGRALALLLDGESAGLAAEIVATNADPLVLAAALEILEWAGGPEHVAPVRVMVSSSNPIVRGAAASALGSIGEQQDAAKLLDVAHHDPSPWVAIRAARALRRLGLGGPELRALASSEDERSTLALQVMTEGGGR